MTTIEIDRPKRLRILSLMGSKQERRASVRCGCGKKFIALLGDVNAGRIVACDDCQPKPGEILEIMPSPPPAAEKIDLNLPGELLSVFGFLLSVARGRREFATSISDLVEKVNCSEQRLEDLLKKLAQRGLIELRETKKDAVRISIIIDPKWRRRELREGERWVVPPPRSEDAQWRG